MSEGVVISEGSPRDLNGVMTVMEESFDPAYGEAWTAPQCAGLLPMPGVGLRLAHCGEHVAGFALHRVVAGEAELLLLAVRHDEQRKGIASALMEDFLAGMAERGVRRLHLEVRDGNPAVKLYNRFGFSEVGRRRNYYTGSGGEVYDALTLSRPTRA